MKTRNVMTAAVAAGALLTITPAAFAAGNGRNDPILGNVTGSSISDRTTLGYDDTSCTATVERGLGHGNYAAPVVHHYSVPGLQSTRQCPDMGVTIKRRWSATDDLAVTFFDKPISASSAVYVLRNFQVRSGSEAGSFPSFVGSEDFNGDGRGDLWESTDQQQSFTTLIRDGRGFVPGAASFINSTSNPSVAFGKLDNKAGTDIAAGYVSLDRDQNGLPNSTGTGALVVFGKSGDKVLLERDETGTKRYTVAIVDANCDGRKDVRVSDNSGAAPRTYLGDGRGHFTLAKSHGKG